MIKYFRTIRKKLLAEGKTGKYFKYAVGEIVLVVVGILIALSINNWNEERKLQDVEKRLLMDLRESIINDYESVIPTLKATFSYKRSAEIILVHLDQGLPYHDSLSNHFPNVFGKWTLIIQQGSYEKAKLYGLDFIENDTTRERLKELFETNAPLVKILDERRSLFYYNTVTPILATLFEPARASQKSSELPMYKTLDTALYPMSELANIIEEAKHYGIIIGVPYDYEGLKNNKAYRNILKTTLMDLQGYIDYSLWTLSLMVELDNQLKEELDNR